MRFKEVRERSKEKGARVGKETKDERRLMKLQNSLPEARTAID